MCARFQGCTLIGMSYYLDSAYCDMERQHLARSLLVAFILLMAVLIFWSVLPLFSPLSLSIGRIAEMITRHRTEIAVCGVVSGAIGLTAHFIRKQRKS